MPPRIEIPELVSMHDPALETSLGEAERRHSHLQRRLNELQRGRQHLLKEGGSRTARRTELDAMERQEQEVLRELEVAQQQVAERQDWVMPRNLAHHYLTVVKRLDTLSRERNNAARMAKGTVPRWFAALPCESPFEVWQTERSDWGDKVGKRLLVRTPVLTRDHRYPLERRLVEIVAQELAEGRRVMLYFEQNDLRSMARRLEEVVKDFSPWTLPNGVEAEDRQEAILAAVKAGKQVVIVPYRRVNEGLNLQQGIDTIVWVEMAMNLFMLDQASRRAWRLGKQEEVRIYYLVYAGTVGHSKLRKLGGQSGAAAAFAGEPARGALIEHAGADQTTLARLSASLEREEDDGPPDLTSLLQVDDREQLKAAFAKRGAELQAALTRGRQWFGMTDTLPQRLRAILAAHASSSSVWHQPSTQYEPTTKQSHPRGRQDGVVVDALPDERPPEQDGRDVHAASAVLPIQMAQEAAHRRGTSAPVLPHRAEEESSTALPSFPGASLPAAVGAKAVVVFGSKEHIELVRTGRKPGRTRTRPRARTEVQAIPALSENATQEPATRTVGKPGPVYLSLWPDNLSFLDASCEGTPASQAAPTTRLPQQSNLW